MHDDTKTTPELAPELTRKSMLAAFAAMVGMMISWPTMVVAPLGLLVVPVSEAFGIGRGTFGLLTGLSMLLGALLTPFAGQAMDRFGVRRVVLPGIAGLGVVQLLIGVVPLSVPLLTILLLLQGAVSCLVTPLPYAKVLSLWFHHRRGIMLGIGAAIGIGAGAGICVTVVGALLENGGWRLTYLGTGAYILVVGGLIVAPLLREPALVERAKDEPLPASLPGMSRREALAAPSFRLVMLMAVSCIGAVTIMMGQGPALLAGRGLDIGPIYLGCAAIGSLTGQLISGVLLDRIDSPKVGLFFALATMVGGAVILHFGTTTAIVIPATLLMGLGQGAETGLASYYVSRFCGLRAYASIFAFVMALVSVSGGVFPAIAGYIYDRNGNYDAAIPMVDLLFVLAPLAILLMPRYRFSAAAPPMP